MSKNPGSRPKRKFSRVHKPDDMSLKSWQIALRQQFGREQDFLWQNVGNQKFFSEFLVSNTTNESSYRVAIRGAQLGDNHCSCADFVSNELGTCKHIEFTLGKLEKKRGAKTTFRRGFDADYSEVWLRYGAERHICFRPGRLCSRSLLARARKTFDADQGWRLRHESLEPCEEFIAAGGRARSEVRVYDDVLRFISVQRRRDERQQRLDLTYDGDPEAVRNLLNLPLYPYQQEGALFAAKAGRALIADDMGLGKTIQAIAGAEILYRHDYVSRILVVCPASLKHQWHNELARLCDRQSTIIGGNKVQRSLQWASPADYKITNYETLSRDMSLINAWEADLVILDEAQRIKNWDTRTARTVKRLRCDYAFVLTGTPLENRLEELVSIVQFVDLHRLGPTWRFLDKHQIRSDTGQIVGYQHLNDINLTLASIMIRRRKAEVLDQLPPRVNKDYLMPMLQEQQALHDEHQETVARIVARWRRYGSLSEKDRLHLMIALQRMRMACVSSYLLLPETDHGTKIPELMRILDDLLVIPDTKVVVFSQWLRSHELLSQALQSRKFGHVVFHGGVPTQRRGELIEQFREDSDCRVFLSTDAGGVGLNLQCANVVVNLDVPWNPAVKEQRIGRVHRLGQHQSVQVLNFISERSIEERMLGLLEFKGALAAGVLDGGEAEIQLEGGRLSRFMNGVVELSSPKPRTITTDKVDEPPRPRFAVQPGSREPPPPVALQPNIQATGQANPLQSLLTTVAGLLNELAEAEDTAPKPGSLVQRDSETGERYLKLPVPDNKTIMDLAKVLSGWLGSETDRR